MLRARAGIALLALTVGGCDVVFNLHEPEPPPPPPPERWDQVSGGQHHTCGIRLDHTLWCWGRNDYGQLGGLDPIVDLEHDEPMQVGTAADWIAVECGPLTTCAINASNALYCWGQNNVGQIGSGIPNELANPMPSQIPGTWRSVSAGLVHGCAISTAGALSCWGYNEEGELGDQAMMPGPAIRQVTSALTWKSVSAGDRSSCAVADDGTGWCWGQNIYGQLGIGSGPNQPAPMRVGTGTWTEISAGNVFACGLQPEGRVRCWGRGTFGQIGNGGVTDVNLPVAVGNDEVTDWVEIDAGGQHACGRRATGDVLCWGDNELGQLISTLEMRQRTVPTPTLPIANAVWTELSLGESHTCLIDDQAQLWCAGFAATGTLGDGTGTFQSPVELDGLWSKVATGFGTTCAITTANQLSCWGNNSEGQVGDGTTDDRRLPTQIAGTWADVRAGRHVCGLSTSPGANGLCWGRGAYGGLGTGVDADSAVPVATSGSMTYSEIVASTGGHSCGLVGTSAYCWGHDDYGQTGQPAGNLVWDPAVVAGSYRAIAVGHAHSCAIRSDDTIACWGFNSLGALGGTNLFATHVPQDVSVPSRPFTELTAGENHSCGRADTQVWCWGANEHGQLGKGSTSVTELPSAVAGSWLSIAAGGNHTCGVRSDRSIACWGANEWGQLGIGSLFPRVEPSVAGTDQDWDRVFAGALHTCALKQDGRLFCWGINSAGQIGVGTAWRPELVMVTK